MEFDAQPIVTALRAIGDGTKNTKAVLRRFNNYLRGKTFDHFREEKGWPALAKSTTERSGTLFDGSTGTVEDRNRLRAEASVRAKLKRELKRANKSFSEEARARRAAVLAEFESYLRERAAGTVMGPDTKTLAKTKERLGRAEERSGKKLGRLRASIVSSFTEDGLTIESRVPWASVHNEGGTAGNGAVIPARPFLFMTPEDEQKLVEIAEDYLTELVNGEL